MLNNKKTNYEDLFLTDEHCCKIFGTIFTDFMSMSNERNTEL